ncbi:tumor necrosis factor receptor superfamily member 1A isoform X1 [Lates calcarifer]|uniref:Tumor necrosis factor receptor superfamily member 1A isoform X1 n=1 Tax=Lates calcarifer TaxID=8187 RepID=A0AAJ7PTH9_LATCA|nr:tumor necrosis factor receptor superfamily member 1A isoform X1 [Lates calcarifer]
MEGAGPRGRRNITAPVGTILLLVCMFIPALAALQSTVQPKCKSWEYDNEKGHCCDKCHAGFKLLEVCHGDGQRSKCVPCPDRQYTDQINYSPNCRSCSTCKKNEILTKPCGRSQNTICQCKDGYYKAFIDSGTYECRKCTKCGPDETTIKTCTPEQNTVCECKENYYRVMRKCEPCKSCGPQCSQHCTPSVQNTKDPDTTVNEFPVNIIIGVGAVVLVLFVLAVLVTYMATKWFTKQTLLQPSSQPSDVSPDSCEQVLISGEEPLDNSSVKAIPKIPTTEQEPSNLPDCVPLEINISDLIYTVLDLVPVLQVKQLVRILGVRDTEIEQAELDNRSCREAHYQMLRVWAERGSHVGGGGRRGGMLHRPLLQELLDKLRQMHLGRAAEELETKYGIQ